MPNSHPHLDLGLTQLRLIKTAFACDYVRVATFMWSAGTNWVVFPGTFQGATIAGNLQSTPHHPAEPRGDTATNNWLNQINAFYSSATATALQEFAQPARHRRRQADRQHDRRLRHRGRARLRPQPAEHAAHGVRREEHRPQGRHVPEGDRRLAAASRRAGTGNRPFNDLWLALLPNFGVDAQRADRAPSIRGNTYLGISGAPMYTGALPGLFA